MLQYLYHNTILMQELHKIKHTNPTHEVGMEKYLTVGLQFPLWN